MLNEMLWIVMTVIIFAFTVVAYRLFGKGGLYAWSAVLVILANIQVLKTIQFFGLVTAMGNVLYGATFLITDILSENHGRKSAQKAVFIGFFSLIATTVIMQMTLHFIPDESDILSPALEQIFSFLPRIAFASLTAYLVSQNFDVWFYSVLKKKKTALWARNNLSTMVSQFLDNIIFTTIAFTGILEVSVMIEIFITSYMMKWIVAAMDTPFIYLAKKWKSDNKINNSAS